MKLTSFEKALASLTQATESANYTGIYPVRIEDLTRLSYWVLTNHSSNLAVADAIFNSALLSLVITEDAFSQKNAAISLVSTTTAALNTAITERLNTIKWPGNRTISRSPDPGEINSAYDQLISLGNTFTAGNAYNVLARVYMFELMMSNYLPAQVEKETGNRVYSTIISPVRRIFDTLLPSTIFGVSSEVIPNLFDTIFYSIPEVIELDSVGTRAVNIPTCLKDILVLELISRGFSQWITPRRSQEIATTIMRDTTGLYMRKGREAAPDGSVVQTLILRSADMYAHGLNKISDSINFISDAGVSLLLSHFTQFDTWMSTLEKRRSVIFDRDTISRLTTVRSYVKGVNSKIDLGETTKELVNHISYRVIRTMIERHRDLTTRVVNLPALIIEAEEYMRSFLPAFVHFNSLARTAESIPLETYELPFLDIYPDTLNLADPLYRVEFFPSLASYMFSAYDEVHTSNSVQIPRKAFNNQNIDTRFTKIGSGVHLLHKITRSAGSEERLLLRPVRSIYTTETLDGLDYDIMAFGPSTSVTPYTQSGDTEPDAFVKATLRDLLMLGARARLLVADPDLGLPLFERESLKTGYRLVVDTFLWAIETRSELIDITSVDEVAFYDFIKFRDAVPVIIFSPKREQYEQLPMPDNFTLIPLGLFDFVLGIAWVSNGDLAYLRALADSTPYLVIHTSTQFLDILRFISYYMNLESDVKPLEHVLLHWKPSDYQARSVRIIVGEPLEVDMPILSMGLVTANTIADLPGRAMIKLRFADPTVNERYVSSIIRLLTGQEPLELNTGTELRNIWDAAMADVDNTRRIVTILKVGQALSGIVETGDLLPPDTNIQPYLIAEWQMFVERYYSEDEFALRFYVYSVFRILMYMYGESSIFFAMRTAPLLNVGPTFEPSIHALYERFAISRKRINEDIPFTDHISEVVLVAGILLSEEIARMILEQRMSWTLTRE